MKILLGSNSPRRNELLKQMDITFEKVQIICDEDFDSNMDVLEVPEFLSTKKSLAYDKLEKDELLITADTVVIHNNRILNKPRSTEEAKKMLRSLSGNTHRVVTGVTIRKNEDISSFRSVTDVSLLPISDDDIVYYVSKYKPMDKAGSYGIQEWFGLTSVMGINGCFYNVVGLPCSALFKRLKNDYGAI